MSELHDKQVRFMRDLPRLIDKAFELGYEVVAGELYRTPEQAALNAKTGAGIANSLHTQRLAVDLMLFKAGTYLVLSSDYEPLGVFWESLSKEHYWGGRFAKPDGDHFSITYQGVR